MLLSLPLSSDKGKRGFFVGIKVEKYFFCAIKNLFICCTVKINTINLHTTQNYKQMNYE